MRAEQFLVRIMETSMDRAITSREDTAFKGIMRDFSTKSFSALFDFQSDFNTYNANTLVRSADKLHDDVLVTLKGCFNLPDDIIAHSPLDDAKVLYDSIVTRFEFSLKLLKRWTEKKLKLSLDALSAEISAIKTKELDTAAREASTTDETRRRRAILDSINTSALILSQRDASHTTSSAARSSAISALPYSRSPQQSVASSSSGASHTPITTQKPNTSRDPTMPPPPPYRYSSAAPGSHSSAAHGRQQPATTPSTKKRTLEADTRDAHSRDGASNDDDEDQRARTLFVNSMQDAFTLISGKFIESQKRRNNESKN
jgi:hypothetical protein